MKFANLHLHSTFSDGGFRPTHLACMAKSLGYGALALTDHETIRGVPELLAAAKNEGIEAMTGVELYARHTDGRVYHIVGLDFDLEHPAIVSFTEKMTGHRNEHTRRQYELAVERGLFPRHVTWDDIVRCNPGAAWFCNDQVYYALDALGEIPIWRRGETYRAAFKEGEAAQIKIFVPEMHEVIAAIRDAGGIPILAHPPLAAFNSIRDMVDLGLRGIEISHPHVDEARTKLAIHAAMEYNLYCSGGTDHTGAMSGCGGTNAVPALEGATLDEFTAIRERVLG